MSEKITIDTLEPNKCVMIWFDRASQALVHNRAITTYQKGDLFCVAFFDDKTGKTRVAKYPLRNIFRIVEDW